MFNDQQLDASKKALQRVFSLPITRSSFRELQNIILNIAQGNQETAQKFIETLLTGKLEGKSPTNKTLQNIIDTFSVTTWVAKEVHEKGEFLNLLTSDILTQGGNVVFSNRIRRVDGKELHFLSDFESSLQVLQHFINRIQESAKLDPVKKNLSKHQAKLKSMQNQLDQIAKSSG